MNPSLRHLDIHVTGSSREAVLRGLERAVEQYRTSDLKVAIDGGLDEIGNWRFAYNEITSDD